MIDISGVNNILSAPRRTVKGRVALYEGATLTNTFNYNDVLSKIVVERTGEEGKFFGFGICQKAKVELADKDRTIGISKNHSFDTLFGVDIDAETVWTSHFPRFYVDEVKRDENNNTLSITAYDCLYDAASRYTVADLELDYPIAVRGVAAKCARLIGLDGITVNGANVDGFAEIYNSINVEGTETIRAMLNAIAEITQTIYFVEGNKLVFRQLGRDDEPDFTISKAQYFTLTSEGRRILTHICHTTELGDNLEAGTEPKGETQYIRDNPFWELNENIATLIEQAVAAISGLSMCPFECSWRGNFLLQLGDKIAFTTKDNSTFVSYMLSDVITYDGGLSETTNWKYGENKAETAANPTNLGEVLNKTFAKVDKVNKTVEIVASESETTSNRVSSIQMATDNISMSVQNVETLLDDTNASISELSSRVDMAITADDVKIEIKNEMANGVDKITTATGFTFNDEGLTVSKTGSEMTTQITEDGMTVSRDNNVVLTANNTGVQATNLHATTYLIIGTNSRIENYGSSRTGCFWIGG